EPPEERVHLELETCSRGRSKVDALAAHPTGDDLHRAAGVVAPLADADSMDAAATAGEQRSMPAEQAIPGQRRGEVTGRVEGHLDDAFDVTIGGRQGADVDAESPGDRRSHLRGLEDLALDLAGLGHVARE